MSPPGVPFVKIMPVMVTTGPAAADADRASKSSNTTVPEYTLGRHEEMWVTAQVNQPGWNLFYGIALLVERAFPLCDDNRGHAVADEVGQGARF